MRICFAAAVCTWGCLAGLGAAQGAEITSIASSAEDNKPFGFKISAIYGFNYKTASITRESQPLSSNSITRSDLFNMYGGALRRTEIIPDLLYSQQRHTLSVKGEFGIFQAVQLGFEVPLILQDTREYNLDPQAGYNHCATGSWGCIAGASSTYLDGIYPIQPADQTSSLVLRAPFRGGSGLDILDTINLSLTASPIYQKRDPTKPTWVIGIEGQISVGTIMEYDTTRLRLPTDSKLVKKLDDLDVRPQRGWNGVSEGLHRVIFRTALSHRFRYFDPYLGLWYMLPVPRLGTGSPWQDYGFEQKRPSPQHAAGTTFGFEVVPLENKAKGHRLSLDFRGAINFHFLGRGYSEAWELLAASNALICDDETALPPRFNYKDDAPRPGVSSITQGTFNPACRAPRSETTTGADNRARLPQESPYYHNAYTGLTTIDNYLTFSTELGVLIKLWRHLRIRLAFNYLRDQGHVITMDDAGTVSYPSGQDRNTLNGKNCIADRVDLNCPYDWNPAYRAVINSPGRRYRVDDVNQYSGTAMLQVYY